jgi:hypothetical protein
LILVIKYYMYISSFMCRGAAKNGNTAEKQKVVDIYNIYNIQTDKLWSVSLWQRTKRIPNPVQD